MHGHLDYVRTVDFHHEMPWIVSIGGPRNKFVLSSLCSSLALTIKQFAYGTVPPAIASLSSQDTRIMSCPPSSTLKTT